MALIKCPECGNEISDQAAACPKCGYPCQPEKPEAEAETEADKLIRQTLEADGKIAAIKLCREQHAGMGLAEAKAYVERLEAAMQPTGGKPRAKVGCSSVLVGLLLATVLGLGALRAMLRSAHGPSVTAPRAAVAAPGGLAAR
jgi:ribosomal protein L7/L12